MVYEAELGLLQSTFGKYGVQTLRIDPTAPLDKRVDIGLGLLAGNSNYYTRSFYECVPPVNKATLYMMEDSFGCKYIYFLLPESKEMLIIGPYTDKMWSHGMIMEKVEQHALSPRLVPELETYYRTIAHVNSNDSLFYMLEAFAERLWGGSNRFTTEVVEMGGFNESVFSGQEKREPQSPEQEMWNMQVMEKRYAFENDLMQAISHGQIHKAEMILLSLSELSFEKRLADPLRNVKNYGIVVNTLLRKAAEQGGVHPLYLDKMSSQFARKLEQLETVGAMSDLVMDMARSYCRLVKKYTLQTYSSPVQKCIVCIDADLTQDLSLGNLAKLQNISAAYLSALFRKETGQTLTDFVNYKRVEHAKKLLVKTDLQIQTIAQHCGILDIHYFSRVFKKYTDQTPKEYRSLNK